MPTTKPSELVARYREWRKVRPDLSAKLALAYAKDDLARKAVLARFSSWEFQHSAYGAFAHADLEGVDSPYKVRVLIGDDDQPVEWGDDEPTDEEREAAKAYYVAIVVLDSDDDEIYHEGIGGVDTIDLPGHSCRDWEDAAAYALIDYLLEGAERFAVNETVECAYWAARDVVTI